MITFLEIFIVIFYLLAILAIDVVLISLIVHAVKNKFNLFNN